jgi:hypothetical protein
MRRIGHRKAVQPERRVQQPVIQLRIPAERQPASQMGAVPVSLIPQMSREALIVEADRREVAGHMPTVEASERAFRPSEFLRPVSLRQQEQSRVLQPAGGQHKRLGFNFEGAATTGFDR